MPEATPYSAILIDVIAPEAILTVFTAALPIWPLITEPLLKAYSWILPEAILPLTTALLPIWPEVTAPELKEKLFKQTIEQLKQTFEKNDLDKLQNLYFDFDLGEEDTNLDINEPAEEPESTELVEEWKTKRQPRVRERQEKDN